MLIGNIKTPQKLVINQQKLSSVKVRKTAWSSIDDTDWYSSTCNKQILHRLRLFALYSFRKFYVGSEMKRKDFCLRQHCFHTEPALMLSFSFVYLISNYSQQRPCSIHRIPPWTQVPTATVDALGFLTTSGWWPGSLETAKVLCDICHAMQTSNGTCSLSALHPPWCRIRPLLTCRHIWQRQNIQVSNWSSVLPFNSDLDHPLMILASLWINILFFFLFSCFLSYKCSY